MTTHPTACILCTRNCGLEVSVEGRTFTKIRGDERHPLSQGYLCQKAARLGYYQDNADRIDQPLRRRPDGSFEPISWDTAWREIAARLLSLRKAHGGACFAFYGGGGQGNHLGGAYGSELRKVMGSPYAYNALAQEKTGDFWVNGRIFGDQSCHVTEDIERSDFVLFIGTNPWQAHGIRNARDVLRELSKSPTRRMVVIDPRRTETARLAHTHLQIRPGSDAFLLAAMLALLVREGWVDRRFLDTHTHGYEQIAAALREVPIDDYIARADVPRDSVFAVTRELAQARSACVRVDLGLNQSPHSTLNSYLEKLVFLLTGNFGKRGGNNLHTQFLPIIGNSPEGAHAIRSKVTGMAAISQLYPPNILPAEIDTDHPERIRALFVDSANPALTSADTPAYARALAKLELLVVVDVAMTETARHAHYVLPAASQFEKWEATGFTLEFPKNYFHLRAPLLNPKGQSLPEPEIYQGILRAMGELPARGFPGLRAIARLDRRMPAAGLFWAALGGNMLVRPRLRKLGAHVLYDTLGQALPEGQAAAPLWFLSHAYALRHRKAVRRAGHHGVGLGLGEALFRSVREARSGMLLSEHHYAETWSLVRHRDRKLRLVIPELLGELRALNHEPGPDPRYPFVLIAGDRRAYNANAIYRDPAWRRQHPKDATGSLRIHPTDAERLGLRDGMQVRCRSPHGELSVVAMLDDGMRPGVVSLPHGYGIQYQGGPALGPALNMLTWAAHCDRIAATPFHKHVPVALDPLV